ARRLCQRLLARLPQRLGRIRHLDRLFAKCCDIRSAADLALSLAHLAAIYALAHLTHLLQTRAAPQMAVLTSSRLRGHTAVCETTALIGACCARAGRGRLAVH